MNDMSFVHSVKHELAQWLLATKDSSSVLWAITDIVRQYESKVGYSGSVKVTENHPDPSER